ncbi:phenylacetate--CoA ligase family protein [Streptomyces sp. NPDC097107]|uniref:phenylacetate--CoA ligase family protein n=1 Tax=Streptomyces sp. NPDC097107 TaxID=3366089 RepID=UPI0037FA96EE
MTTTSVDRPATRTDRLHEALTARRGLARRVARVAALDRTGLDAWAAYALTRTVAHAHRNSPFYADRIPASLVEALATDPGALRAVPFTTRGDLAAAYPLGLLAVPLRDVTRFDESSGTGDGSSIAAFFSAEDWVENNLTVARLLSAVLGPDDVVAVAVPYELAGVGQDLDRALELLGCTIVPLGAASPDCPPERMVGALARSGATALICSGTRALLLGETARRGGLDPARDLRVRHVLTAGEGASPAKKALLARQWDAAVHSMFGMTETNTLAMFCARQDLHLVETRTWFEIVDPATGEPLPDGSSGELAVTTLASRAMPLVRYRTGDTCLIEAEPCPCGSPLRRLRHRGRLGDRIAVGHGSASQLEIEDVVLGALTRPPYYFAFDVEDTALHVALPPDSAADDRVRDAIAEGARRRFGAGTRFGVLDVPAFEHALRTSAKPTMRTFLRAPQERTT